VLALTISGSIMPSRRYDLSPRNAQFRIPLDSLISFCVSFSKRLREPDVLTPGEFSALVEEFRHSLATNLRAAGADLKTAQVFMRHANSRITLDIYTRAISANKREANNKVMEMVIEAGKSRFSAPSSAPSQREPLLLGGSKKVSGTLSTLAGHN
jgi:hypothetical protein